MPREDRRVYFEQEESYKAIYTLCGQKGMSKPVAGLLRRVDINIENPLELNFYIENSKNAQLEVSTYTKDFVIAALMIMCRNLGVPLAKRANKTIEIIHEKLVLRVQILR